MTTDDKQAMEKESSSPRQISRRRFLEIAGAAAAGLLISSCSPGGTTEPASEQAAPTEAATAVPPTPTEAATTVAPTATPQPTVAPTGLSSRVAIAKCEDYDRDRIYNAVRDMLDDLGGLGDVVRPGDRVAIKTNLTGGLGNEGPPGFSPMESFVTHPEVVRALGALTLDAGAKEVLIVEAVYQWGSYVEWGYEDIAEDIGATLIDLNATDPYDDFIDAKVPGGGEVYEDYIFNPLLQEVDVFMSAAKMKCHNTAGVTHSLKNLFGLVPARFYRLSQQHSHRSAFHGPSADIAGERVPRIIVDLNKTRPIHFALIDGVLTTEGGEGPWLKDFGPIAPGVLFAGKDPVAADAVATAAQGFDPTAPAFTKPFIRSLNHLNLAVEAGLGTNRLDEIEVFGPSIDEVKRDFRVSYS